MCIQNAHNKRKKGNRCTSLLSWSVGWLSCLEKLVKTKVLPIFLYGVAVAAPMSKQAWAQLERLNHFAARLVTNDYQSSYNNLLFDLGCWGSVGRTCFERRGCLAFKYVHSLRHLPGDCIAMRVNPRRHSMRIAERDCHRLQLCIPSFMRHGSDRLPVFQLFRVWNAFTC